MWDLGSVEPPDLDLCHRLGQTIRERLKEAQDALALQVYRRLEPRFARGPSPRAGAAQDKRPTELFTLILSQLDAKLALPTDPRYGDTLLLAYGVGAYLDLLLGHAGEGSEAAKEAMMIYANPRGDLTVFKQLVDCSPQRVRDAVASASTG